MAVTQDPLNFEKDFCQTENTNYKLMSFSLDCFHSDVTKPHISTSKISNGPLTRIKLLVNLKYH